MINFDKSDVRENLTDDNIFELLTAWGGNPEVTNFGFISHTICHNPANTGSRKLYYYKNTGLFKCFTHCGTFFDIFELAIKVFKIQEDKELDLNDAVRWIAQRFNIRGTYKQDFSENEDWAILQNYARIEEIISTKTAQNDFILKEYDDFILGNLDYKCLITPWLKEGITQQVLSRARIGYYPGNDQISIPHYDKNNRFIGLRGRSVVQEDIELYGKYRPMKINQVLYTHPLGMNLYNLNNSKENIKNYGKAMVFEGEKSCLLYQSYFGFDNDISVACCGSSISNYQINLLLESGAKEIVVAFDRQFEKIGDDEFNHLKQNIIRLYNKYKSIVNMSFIFDKKMITNYKDSPIDKGPDIFMKLYKERIML